MWEMVGYKEYHLVWEKVGYKELVVNTCSTLGKLKKITNILTAAHRHTHVHTYLECQFLPGRVVPQNGPLQDKPPSLIILDLVTFLCEVAFLQHPIHYFINHVSYHLGREKRLEVVMWHVVASPLCQLGEGEEIRGGDVACSS